MSISIPITDQTCTRGTTIHEVLRRINNRSPHLFQIVVDQEGRLLGTVTDGDIRRAMLHGVGLDDLVEACMKREPVVGRIGETDSNFDKLHALGGLRAFIPLVDEAGVVCQILVAQAGPNAGITDALVMAGGRGARLGWRTENTPKPLLPVAGRPILDHVITALENNGITTVYISVHYLADKIEAFVAGRENRAIIKLVPELEQLGTAGALANLQRDARRDPILVVNGDVITDTDFRALEEFHQRHGYDATIAVARYDIDIPFGIVHYTEDSTFSGIEEKPNLSHFIAAGIYYLSPEFCALVQAGKPMDMPELLQMGHHLGLKVGLFPIHEYWADVGSPQDLEKVEKRHEKTR